MNAHTAPQSLIIPTISATASAGTASSTTPTRIDSFIKEKLKAAAADDFSGLSDSSNRAAQLGFKNAANVRYAGFLEAFRNSPALSARYAEIYPSCLFLPWRALHATIEALDLWVDLPEFYMGAIPGEQLPWLEAFEIVDQLEDRPGYNDISHAIQQDLRAQHSLACIVEYGIYGSQEPMQRLTDPLPSFQRAAKLLAPYWEAMRSSFFVVAPKEAFSTTEDWLARLKRLSDRVETELTTPPDDPLVIRFVRGGALVVAAWGDEAAVINQTVRSLKL